jgi:CMP-N-acetylneuraminic acid synthetase
MSSYLGLIPARGGSKGVPQKNIREFAGQPLLTHTIEAATAADQIDRTVVTTDNEKIRAVAREYGAEAPFLRPAELATDDAPAEPVIEHAVNYLAAEDDYECDAVVLLQPTSPLRDAAAIDAAIDRYEEADASSLVAVSEDHSNRWRRTEDGPQQVNYETPTRRQEKAPEYVETGAIYITDTEQFLSTGTIRVGNTALSVMDDYAAVDIDTPFDFWLAEQIMTDWLADDGETQ